MGSEIERDVRSSEPSVLPSSGQPPIGTGAGDYFPTDWQPPSDWRDYEWVGEGREPDHDAIARLFHATLDDNGAPVDENVALAETTLLLSHARHWNIRGARDPQSFLDRSVLEAIKAKIEAYLTKLSAPLDEWSEDQLLLKPSRPIAMPTQIIDPRSVSDAALHAEQSFPLQFVIRQDKSDNGVAVKWYILIAAVRNSNGDPLIAWGNNLGRLDREGAAPGEIAGLMQFHVGIPVGAERAFINSVGAAAAEESGEFEEVGSPSVPKLESAPLLSRAAFERQLELVRQEGRFASKDMIGETCEHFLVFKLRTEIMQVIRRVQAKTGGRDFESDELEITEIAQHPDFKDPNVFQVHTSLGVFKVSFFSRFIDEQGHTLRGPGMTESDNDAPFVVRCVCQPEDLFGE